MPKPIKMTGKEMKKFNKDPLKWIVCHIGREIKLPKKDIPKQRWFIVRFDNLNKDGSVNWEIPDFCEEVTYKELRTLAVDGGTWQFATKLVNWINGDKYGK